ncbi:MAG: glycerol-3-phosphate 1-O-acyltransferase PlsY [Bacteroidales bacterium]|nr:glycerol-3-phosphate 1-O-acyltransferase PlsY [Bacteroidales bacterium]
MTKPLLSIGLFILSYLLGSIPSAVWIGKLVHRVDVREHGSGNAGATNVLRVLGWKTAIPVLFIDMVKGFAAVHLLHLTGLSQEGRELINMEIVAGVCAVLGHIFPVFAQFRGGKGVATVTGVVIAIQPYPSLIAACVFLLVLMLTRYVSLSSISAGLAFPLSEIFFFQTGNLTLLVFSLAIFVGLLITHYKNIERLFEGKENKITIKGQPQSRIAQDYTNNPDRIY